VQYLAEGLARLGHEVSVATRMNGNKFPTQEELNGVKILRFDCWQDLFKRNIGECDRYIEFVVNYPKDILILECLQCHTTDILLPYLDKMNCKKVIHTHGAPGILMNPFEWEGDILHTIGHTHNWLRWKHYYGHCFPKYAKKIDAGICLSLCASDLDYLSNNLKQMYIAENAANDIFFDEENYQLDISSIIGIRNKKYIVNISNYCDRKNQLLLMDSFAKTGLKDISLVLIGSKPNAYYNKCVKHAEQLKREYGIEIVLLHDIDRKYFPTIIKGADLFVMTSKWEEYPVSLVEAMSVGTPFFSTPVGNAHILPGGVTSRFNGEIPSLLKILLTNNLILERLSKQGKKYAIQNNTLETVVKNYNKILSDIYNEH
jgi:glycosyltransferase involved in cell wall biosynthesis